MCNHVFKPLWYVCDDDYGITTNKVYLGTRYDNKGHLAYCTKCGQVFVKEIQNAIDGEAPEFEKIPSAEPEQKKGKWKSDKKITPVYDSLFEIEDGYLCSECGRFVRTISNYCPHCGADMRGEEDE